MIERRSRSCSSPILAMSRPSISIVPCDSSRMRNSDCVMVDLPTERNREVSACG